MFHLIINTNYINSTVKLMKVYLSDTQQLGKHIEFLSQIEPKEFKKVESNEN